MYVRHREIKEETEDRIVVADSVLTIWCVLWGLFMIVLGLCCVAMGIAMFVIRWAETGHWLIPAIIWLFAIWMGGYGMLETLKELLIKKTFIIDRKHQSIIIERDSFIKYLKSIKKISFLDIEYIEMQIDIDDGKVTGHRDISLIMIHGKKINIYDGDHVPTEKLAKNIRNITTKQIARKNNCYSSTSSAG